MTSRPEAATLVPVQDVSRAFLGLKVRTAGVVLSYDDKRASITLASGRHTLNVDVGLLLNGEHDERGSVDNSSETIRLGNTVFAVGTVESVEDDKDKENVVLSCIRLFDAQSLNLPQWEYTARRISQALHQRAEQRQEDKHARGGS